MATATTNSPLAVTLDATFVIAYCAREPSRYAKADAQLKQYAGNGWQFFAPGVLIAEALFVFCRKLAAGQLTTAEHTQAVQSLQTLMRAVLPPPNGDASLIARAEQIRATYGCSRSADGIYLALAEELAKGGTAEIVTFDAGLENQAKKNSPTVSVKLLAP
jgi:predicted nucleic acid-binding protein